MSSKLDVDTLIEMGFTREQAIEALEATGNDVTRAIAHLFGEPSASQPPVLPGRDAPPPPPLSSGTMATLSNPEEVPQILGSRAVSRSTESPFYQDYPTSGYTEEWDANETTIKDVDEAEAEVEMLHVEDQEKTTANSSAVLSMSSDSLDSDSDIEYPTNLKDASHIFPVILNKNPGNKCWAPLLCILSSYAPFSKIVLESANDSNLVKELKRIVYFINNFDKSKRWYVKANTSGEFLPTEPNYQYMDDEVVMNMCTQLMDSIPELRLLFESFVESSDDDINKGLAVLEIESESRYPTLYQSLNELFWQRDFSLLGVVKYHSVAPLVTYQLLCDEESYSTPFQLDEIIHPEIYSAKCEAAIRDQIESIKQAQLSQQALSRKLMNYNFFEGKRIDQMLETTKQALEGEAYGASEDILSLLSQLKIAKETEIKNQAIFKENASPERLRLFDKVLAAVPFLKSYILIGVIISECRYFIRYKGAWIQMEEYEAIDFEELKDIVRHASRIGPHVITLMYADASTIGDVEFIKKLEPKTESVARKNSEILIDFDSDDLELSVCKTEDLNEAEEIIVDQCIISNAAPLNTNSEKTASGSRKDQEQDQEDPNDPMLSDKLTGDKIIKIEVNPELEEAFAAEELDVSESTSLPSRPASNNQQCVEESASSAEH